MKYAVVLVLLGVLACSFADSGKRSEIMSPDGPNFDCTGKNGYFADTYRLCKVFYRCLPDGQKWAYNCPTDWEFADAVETCVPPNQYECPPYEAINT